LLFFNGPFQYLGSLLVSEFVENFDLTNFFLGFRLGDWLRGRFGLVVCGRFMSDDY
jgi:hypothetical protein